MIATYSTARCYYSQIGNSDELCEINIKATSSLLIDVYHKDDMLAYEIQMTEVRQKLQISHTDVIPALRYLPTSSISPPHPTEYQ